MRIITICLSLILLTLTSCSPFYIMRAGWEEAKILLARESIASLVASSDINNRQKEKFNLVIEAREFAKELGLKPKGSFTQYTDVNRDVLVWVLSASPKTSFSSTTWWFPIVGRVPYKGFFNKDTAISEAKKLKSQDLDIYLRPSAAFSTLGWFNDPLLSTVMKFDDVSLANTVIHEIVHNTIWIKDNAHFNETLANFIGTLAAEEFFRRKGENFSKLTKLAGSRLHDELLYADFLKKTHAELQSLYSKEMTTPLSEKEILKQRQVIFSKLLLSWQTFKTQFDTKRYKKGPLS